MKLKPSSTDKGNITKNSQSAEKNSKDISMSARNVQHHNDIDINLTSPQNLELISLSEEEKVIIYQLITTILKDLHDFKLFSELMCLFKKEDRLQLARNVIQEFLMPEKHNATPLELTEKLKDYLQEKLNSLKLELYGLINQYVLIYCSNIKPPFGYFTREIPKKEVETSVEDVITKVDAIFCKVFPDGRGSRRI